MLEGLIKVLFEKKKHPVFQQMILAFT